MTLDFFGSAGGPTNTILSSKTSFEYFQNVWGAHSLTQLTLRILKFIIRVCVRHTHASRVCETHTRVTRVGGVVCVRHTHTPHVGGRGVWGGVTDTTHTPPS